MLEKFGVEMSSGEEVALWAFVVSLFVGGAIVGALFGGSVADKIGR